MESILTSTKKLLGLSEESYEFDNDIIALINSVFATLFQLGVGPKTCFAISSIRDTWNDFYGDDTTLNFLPIYMYLKVKLIFDPPLSSFVIESIKQQISEMEWRLNIAAEGGIK